MIQELSNLTPNEVIYRWKRGDKIPEIILDEVAVENILDRQKEVHQALCTSRRRTSEPKDKYRVRDLVMIYMQEGKKKGKMKQETGVHFQLRGFMEMV